MPTTTAIDETMIERAILDLLKTRREIYPSHIIGEFRRSHAGLPLDRTRDVLERLFIERRVARLWHRYMLPADVEAVRAKWLGLIERQAERIDAVAVDPATSRDARDLVMRWDGWSMEGCDFAD